MRRGFSLLVLFLCDGCVYFMEASKYHQHINKTNCKFQVMTRRQREMQENGGSPGSLSLEVSRILNQCERKRVLAEERVKTMLFPIIRLCASLLFNLIKEMFLA